MHSHAHAHGGTGRVLGWSLAATVAFVVVEAAAGVQARSLSLVADAGHNLTDAAALLLAWFAGWIQTKPANERKTYGYHRTGVLAALANAVTMVALSLWIFYASWERFRNPQPVAETTMMVVAGLGLALNAGIMWGLRGARHSDLNIRSAFLHMLGDALGSVGIIIGAVVIRNTGWRQVDPMLSVLIAGLILWTAWDIVRESLNILLEGLPRGLNLSEVAAALRGVEGVIEIHDLHIWSLGSSMHALSCHVRIEDVPPSSSAEILGRLNGMLCDRYGICHTTVQFEHAGCGAGDAPCALEAHEREHHSAGHRH
ncbi:MAG: cation diffusion facilitator family transporter [Bryobacteraceae bacterium]